MLQRREETAWWAGVLALAALLAVWADLSPLQRFHNSDSLIPVLMSLDRWTPFYWGQNRFGMILPLLALPVRDPFANLLVQVALRLFALFLTFFLLARAVVPRPWWPAAGALTLGLFLAGKTVEQIAFQQMQPYFQAMALALPGIALFDRPAAGAWRVAAGGLLLVLALWVAPVAFFWLVPLLALRRLLGIVPPRTADQITGEGFGHRLQRLFQPRALVPFLWAGLGFGASLLASRLSIYHHATRFGLAPPRIWPRGWRTLAERVMVYLGPWLLCGLGVLLAVAALLAIRRSGRGRPALAAVLCLLGMAAAEVLILGTSAWVHANELRPRFLAAALLATATAGPVLLFGLLLEGRPLRLARLANAAALAALLPLALWRFGAPSPAAARAGLAAGPGVAAARQLVANGCTGAIGDYWTVWPAVFQARVLLGAEHKVWGIAFRSAPTRDLWWPEDWRTARLAILGTPREVEIVRAFYEIPPFGGRRGPSRCTAGTPVVSFRRFRADPRRH